MPKITLVVEDVELDGVAGISLKTSIEGLNPEDAQKPPTMAMLFGLEVHKLYNTGRALKPTQEEPVEATGEGG